MRSAKNILNQKALLTIYYSLIHSHLIYAIQVWSSCSTSDINSLYKLQKQAIRTIHNLKYNGHTESFFKKSKILPLPMLIEFFKLQFMNIFVQGFLPQLFANEWSFNMQRSINHSYHLRNEDDIFVPFARTTFVSKSPYHSFPQAWISFDCPSIKIQREKLIFNKMMKMYFCDKLSSNYRCNRLLCPNCNFNPTASGPFVDLE